MRLLEEAAADTAVAADTVAAEAISAAGADRRARRYQVVIDHLENRYLLAGSITQYSGTFAAAYSRILVLQSYQRVVSETSTISRISAVVGRPRTR